MDCFIKLSYNSHTPQQIIQLQHCLVRPAVIVRVLLATTTAVSVAGGPTSH